jgi:uracil-DNA glycosylase
MTPTFRAALASLYERMDACARCRAVRNPLRHVLGAGAMRPDWMLVLVNPTSRNISSRHSYRGPRFPFIGVRQFWQVLAQGGFMDRALAAGLPPRAAWSLRHTETVQRALVKQRLFLTNAVKCCSDRGDYPSPEVLREGQRLLAEEIRIVRPRRIIAFGALVHRTLAGLPVSLTRYWAAAERPPFHENISGLRIPIVPCFFPIGRGSPSKAAAALRKLTRP